MIPDVNKDAAGILKNIECFALDMDGTIYLGEQWIEGAREFLSAVEAAGKRYVFLTNNSSKNPQVYVKKLSRMGLEVTEEKIVTSGQATIAYLKQHFPGKRVFLLGNELLTEEFVQEEIVWEGLPYLSTHPDYNCPTETGFIPDAGAIHAFIRASAGREPDHIIGKPNRDIMDYLVAREGVDKARTAMVGDRLYTDVAAGVNNGYTGILVLSGEATMEDVKVSDVEPDLIFDSVKDMIPFL